MASNRCNCEQLEREKTDGELHTIHGKLCPARENELRVMLNRVVDTLDDLDRGDETRAFTHVKQVLGTSPRESSPKETKNETG